MATTQEHVSIEDIKEGMLFLKDGGASLVIQTSAVNFGLLSEDEQIAIIDSFAQMLNSLSFAIQINIVSRRLDISSYIKLLDKSLSLQTNPLLAQLMINYRTFVQSLIKENEVLDKSFYIAINTSGLEMGMGIKTMEDRIRKVKTILGPRRDQVLRQLGRIGLKSNQLTADQLIKLFYELYNPEYGNTPKPAAPQQVTLNQPVPIEKPTPITNPQPQTPLPPIQPQAASPQPIAPQPPQTPFINPSPNLDRSSRSHPFVVEELKE
jgi:hypothetical protein